MGNTINEFVLLQLLYLSADHESRSGLFKAMSLLCGSEVDPNNTEVDSIFVMLWHMPL